MVLENVKQLLEIHDNDSDTKLKFYIETIVNKILNICKINSLPKKLEHLVIQYTIEQYELNKNEAQGIKEVTSVSDNGQSVSFKTIGGVSSMSKNADEFVEKNKSEIYSFRKMRW